MQVEDVHAISMVVSDLSIYIVLLSALSLLVYMKISKFLGSLAVFIIGIGLLYRAGSDGWIGLMVMIFGLLMIVNTVFFGKSRRRRR